MSGFLCSMVGATYAVAVAEVIRVKKGITAAGNAQVDTAQSKFGGAAALFDGTGDRLDIGSHSSLAFGTGDFTIELWIRYSSVSGNQTIVDFRSGSNINILLGSDGGAVFLYVNGDYRIGRSGTQFTTNTWYHVALSRSGTSTRLFIDGTQVHSTYTDSNSYVGSDPSFGESWRSSGFGTNGWMDEIRISNNARYTTTFTPSTTPFVNDANTLLLIHADGTDASTFFEDDNGVRAQVGITAVATAQVDTAQSQFGGASLLLDGDSDYLSVLSSDGTFNFGTSEDFTIECWIRATTVDEYHTVIASNNSSYASSAVTFTGGATAQKLRMNIQGIGNVLTDSTALSANTWYHVAVTRSGSSWNLWRDGTSVSSNTNSGWTVNFEGNGGFNIGWTRWDGAVAYWTGYIDEFRISSIARYTGTFTPSTTPFVNDANTLLLIHGDGTDGSTVFRDDNGIGRSPRGIQASGNAQVDTAQSKFGGASALFDGTGDYLTVNNSANTDFEFTAGEDYTLECWVRPAASPSFAGIISLASVRSGNEYTLYTEGGQLRAAIYGGNNLSTTSSTLSTGTWYHVAVSRSGTSVKLFLDGTQVDSDSYTFTAGQQSVVRIGSFGDGTLGWNGHIDEVRISNSARYTATFTAPTAPFVNDANTLLLMHMDGTDGSTVFRDDNGTRPV